MSPAVMFLIELVWLGLFGWYFATDYGTRKRVLALALVVIAVALSIVMIWPPEKKKSDLGGEHVSGSNAYFGNEGWGVQLRFDSEGGKTFGDITEKSKGFRFAIVLDGAIQSAPVIREAIYGGSAQITGRFTEQE